MLIIILLIILSITLTLLTEDYQNLLLTDKLNKIMTIIKDKLHE